MIGSAWKYIAGSPDHEDLVMIEESLNNLAINNNEQIIINNQLQDRINNLTTISNMLANTIQNDNRFSNEIASNLQNQVRLIKEEIGNIKFAIQWAKINVINTLLLNKFELIEINKIFQRNNISSFSVEEMLEFVDVSVLQNKTTIIYMIKIPELEPCNYENLVIKPVIKNQSVVHLDINEIFKSNNKILALPKNCKASNLIKNV